MGLGSIFLTACLKESFIYSCLRKEKAKQLLKVTLYLQCVLNRLTSWILDTNCRRISEPLSIWVSDWMSCTKVDMLRKVRLLINIFSCSFIYLYYLNVCHATYKLLNYFWNCNRKFWLRFLYASLLSYEWNLWR